MSRAGIFLSIVLTCLWQGMTAAQQPPPRASGGIADEVRQLLREGDYKQAIQKAHAYCDDVRRTFGEKDPRYPRGLDMLANVHKAAGNLDQSITAWRQALTALDQIEPTDSYGVVVVSTSLAAAYRQAGKGDQAVACCARALEEAGKVPGDRAVVWQARAQLTLGDVHRQAGRRVQAEQAYRGVVAICEKHNGKDSSEYRQAVASLAQLQAARPEGPRLGIQVAAHDGQGFLVREVVPGGPADRAGIHVGDVIIGHDEQFFLQPKSSPELLARSIDDAPTGKPVPVTFQRAGEVHRVMVVYPPKPLEPVALSEKQQKLVADFGPPDTFVLVMSTETVDGQPRPLRQETWFYYDLRTSFSFVNGKFAGSKEIDALPDGQVYPKWKPENFAADMTLEQVKQLLGEVKGATLPAQQLELNDKDLEGAEFCFAGQVAMAFMDGRLCYVITMPADAPAARQEDKP